jgi:hypothetical protein
MRTVRWVLWLAAAGLLAVTVGIAATRAKRPWVTAARPRPGELSVAAAIGKGSAAGVLVRGYVFEEPALGTLLCGARTRGSPPACTGGFLYLDGLDPSRLNFDEARDAQGHLVGWTGTPVVLGGDLRALTLTVSEIFS